MMAPVAALVLLVSGWGALAGESSGVNAEVEPELRSGRLECYGGFSDGERYQVGAA